MKLSTLLISLLITFPALGQVFESECGATFRFREDFDRLDMIYMGDSTSFRYTFGTEITSIVTRYDAINHPEIACISFWDGFHGAFSRYSKKVVVWYWDGRKEKFKLKP